MNERTSLYLDLLRTLAAFAVVFHHLSYFSGAALFFQFYGHVAVIVFFVLSGYVIAYVADTREKDFPVYAARRLGRLFSVVFPALVLTFVLDRVGAALDPALYEGRAAFDMPLVRFFIHIFFLQEIWFVSVRFSSNGPLWSLGYEFWYYALFGVAVLYRGRFRRSVLALFAALVGPVILLYGLIWMLGTRAYSLHKSGFNLAPAQATMLFFASLAGFFAFPLWSPLIDTGVFQKKFDLDEILTDFIFAAFVFLNIVSVQYARVSVPFSGLVRAGAGISFALYAFHYPLILFFGALNRRFAGLEGPAEFLSLLFLVVLSVFLLAFISEQRKKEYAAFFASILNHRFFKKILAF